MRKRWRPLGSGRTRCLARRSRLRPRRPRSASAAPSPARIPRLSPGIRQRDAPGAGAPGREIALQVARQMPPRPVVVISTRKQPNLKNPLTPAAAPAGLVARGVLYSLDWVVQSLPGRAGLRVRRATPSKVGSPRFMVSLAIQTDRQTVFLPRWINQSRKGRKRPPFPPTQSSATR